MDYYRHIYGKDIENIANISKGVIYKSSISKEERYLVTEYEIFRGVKVFL